MRMISLATGVTGGCVVLLSLLLTVPAWAENWPTWRGPLGNGISTETGLPTSWSTTENVAWRTPLPGPAGATPVIWGEHIFLTSVDGDQLVLLCLGTDGQLKWRRVVGRGNEDVRGDEGNFASPSPVTDGEHVWSFMGNGSLLCCDFEGNEVWRSNMSDRFGPFDIAFGMSSTPVLHGERLFFQFIHGDGDASTHEALVVAIDKRTGDEIWRSPRVTGAHTENEHSYSSPILYDFGGDTFLVTHGGDFTIAYDLESGEELWRLGGLNPHDDPQRPYHPTLRFVASPAAAEGIIVCPTAKNGPVFAVRPGLRGDLTGNQEALLWARPDNTPDVPSPLILDDLVYLCRETGILLCVERETGEQVYYERTIDLRHRASPVYADDKIFLAARDGRVTVVRPGRDFEILSVNDLGEQLSASPAISRGTIYLRTFDALWAIRQE
jgi:outer membrane protein assembly factor BamB